jgi:two-component system, NtrC family, response regulator AtoC
MPAEKILVVDDERLLRWSLRQKCEEWGYDVIEAAAGEPALRLAQNESPDLILLDVRLPDIDGIHVLEQLKKTNCASAVIMMTAAPQLDDVKHALKLGAYDFVGKPLNFEELHITVQNALEAARLRTEVQSLRGEVRQKTGYHDVVAVSAKMTDRGHDEKACDFKQHEGWMSEGGSTGSGVGGCRHELPNDTKTAAKIQVLMRFKF